MIHGAWMAKNRRVVKNEQNFCGKDGNGCG